MPKFFTGDDLGNIKSLQYSANATTGNHDATVNTLSTGASRPVQVLATDPNNTVTAGFADGSVVAFKSGDTGSLSKVREWRETRLREGHRFLGLAASAKGIFSCTSNGALRYVSPEEGDNVKLASVPTRLEDWQMAANREFFAYGGNEVDLSVWDTERAFSSPEEVDKQSAAPRKRKRDELLPGEIWRAKNGRNDNLGLRQPIHITSITYLASDDPSQLLTGTRFGSIRRYDTRSARRPVSDWNWSRTGSIKMVVKGTSEYEAFVADNQCDLFALDLRNGRVIYNYKGLSGAVTSIASSPHGLASTALDRYARIHSTFPPPTEVGRQQDQKGEVLGKIFMTSVPTVIVWDPSWTEPSTIPELDDSDLWDTMERIEDGDK